MKLTRASTFEDEGHDAEQVPGIRSSRNGSSKAGLAGSGSTGFGKSGGELQGVSWLEEGRLFEVDIRLQISI